MRTKRQRILSVTKRGRLVHNVDFNTYAIVAEDGTWRELFPGETFEIKYYRRWLPVHFERDQFGGWYLAHRDEGRKCVPLCGVTVRYTKLA